jgi:hypothetical protein
MDKELENFIETEQQKNVADYFCYRELKKLNYSDEEIATQFCLSKQQLLNLIAQFD